MRRSALLALAFTTLPLFAQTPTPTPSPSPTPEPKGVALVRKLYTKYEHRLPMRDGAKLFASVYVPKDAGPEKSYPILLVRTPYSVKPYGSDNYPERLGPSELAMKDGFIFVYEDVRGRYQSDGEFVDMRPHRPKKGPADYDESTDTWDTVDWLVKNVPYNNGRVGIWGISYPGFYASAGMIDAHPALKAASPQAPIADWFVGDDFHHNGAFFLPHAFNFFSTFGKPRKGLVKEGPPRFEHGTPDGYRYFSDLPPLSEVNEKLFEGNVAFWKEIVEHDTYDAFWQARNLRPHLKGIRPAVMTVGGWFDAENLFGALQTYRSVETQSPGAQNTLVMGPWVHGGWNRTDGDALGAVTFGDKTSLFYRERIELPFFQRHLKLRADVKVPEAWVFETGTNVWRALDSWPPRAAQKKTLRFGPGGRLTVENNGGGPGEPSHGSTETHLDEFVSDPNRPVPFIADTSIGMKREYMTADQRFASSRPDVAVYQTEPLEEDVTLAGPLQARLVVSTTGTDSDWVVKLVDVYPADFPDPDPNPGDLKMGGYQQLVRGDVMRGKFRSSYEKPEPFTPGAPTHVDFALNDVFHTFRRGHRIMVQVQCTWFPLVDRNPQKLMNDFGAKASDYQKATQRLYRSSALEVLVLPPDRPGPPR